jgi:hypothetical protein
MTFSAMAPHLVDFMKVTGVFHHLTLISLNPFGAARDIALALALLWLCYFLDYLN